MSVPQVSASACTSMAARALYMLMQTGHGRCGTVASAAVPPENSHSQGSAEAPGFAIEEVLLDGAHDWHWAQRLMAQESGGMEHLTVPQVRCIYTRICVYSVYARCTLGICTLQAYTISSNGLRHENCAHALQALQALGHRLISCRSWTAAAMATTHGPARHQAKPDARSTQAQQGCSTRGSSPNKEGGHAQQQEPQQASPVQVLVERPELAMLGFATEGFLQVRFYHDVCVVFHALIQVTCKVLQGN